MIDPPCRYGQTGSGKTYTMMGSEDNPGVNRRALTELFRPVANTLTWIVHPMFCMVLNIST